MKLILLLFSAFTIFNTNVNSNTEELSQTRRLSETDFRSEFLDELEYSYEEFKLIVEEDPNNIYYELAIYIGRVEEKIYYGIYFRNSAPNQYYIKLYLNDTLYNLDHSPRGDVSASALDFNHTESFSVLIYDKYDVLQAGKGKFQNIKTSNLAEFSLFESPVIVLGEGNGVNVSKIRSNNVLNERILIYIVLVSVILICGVIILIFYRRGKGMFNSDIKSANVFNFREFLNSTPEITPYEEYQEYEEMDSADIIEEVEPEEERPSSSSKPVNETYRWYHYEEEKSDFDIKAYLENLGYKTNYENIELEEKNRIMLELMRLRDQKEITQDDYLDEISELWKS